MLSGANISAFDGAKLAEYRGNRIGYLFQDFALLDNLTGRENILLPLSIHNIDSSIAEKHLNDIAGFLGIIDVLSKFPAQMSGGQKQRLCIARALLKKPKILILDDSTSAVDTRTDALIRKAFREEIPNTTKIIIAQRVSSIEDADQIIVLDDGKIMGVGTSEELLKTNDIYREVYESQVKGGGDDE